MILYMQEPPMPGWSRLASHCVREIRNRLPEVVGGKRIAKRVEYVQHLDEIALLWIPDTAPAADALDDAREPPIDASAASRRIPRKVYEKIEKLVAEHVYARVRRDDAAFRLFETLMQEPKNQRQTLEPVVNQWLDITEWFLKKSHDGGAGDGDFRIEEFRAKFESFEDLLAGLVRDFFKTTDELDEILEDTNA